MALHPISSTYKDAPGFTTPSPGSAMILNNSALLFAQDLLQAVMNLCWSPISAFYQQHIQTWKGEAHELCYFFMQKEMQINRQTSYSLTYSYEPNVPYGY